MEEKERSPKGHEIVTRSTVIDASRFILPLEKITERQDSNVIGYEIEQPDKKDEEPLGSAFPRGRKEH